MQLKFNPEINLGTIVEVTLLAITACGALVKFGKLEAKLNIMFDWFNRSIIGHRQSESELAVDEDIKKFHGKE